MTSFSKQGKKKNQQSIGVKSFDPNTSYDFECKKNYK